MGNGLVLKREGGGGRLDRVGARKRERDVHIVHGKLLLLMNEVILSFTTSRLFIRILARAG